MYEVHFYTNGSSLFSYIRQQQKGSRSENDKHEKYMEDQKKRFNLKHIASGKFLWPGKLIIMAMMLVKGGVQDMNFKTVKKCKVDEMLLNGVKTSFCLPQPFSSTLRISIVIKNEENDELFSTGVLRDDSLTPPNTNRRRPTPVEHTDTSNEGRVTHRLMAVQDLRSHMALILLFYCYFNRLRLNSSGS